MGLNLMRNICFEYDIMAMGSICGNWSSTTSWLCEPLGRVKPRIEFGAIQFQSLRDFSVVAEGRDGTNSVWDNRYSTTPWLCEPRGRVKPRIAFGAIQIKPLRGYARREGKSQVLRRKNHLSVSETIWGSSLIPKESNMNSPECNSGYNVPICNATPTGSNTHTIAYIP